MLPWSSCCPHSLINNVIVMQASLITEHLTILLSLAWLLWIVLLGIGLILERRSPAATLAWLLALLFMPYFGFLVYLLIGAAPATSPPVTL